VQIERPAIVAKRQVKIKKSTLCYIVYGLVQILLRKETVVRFTKEECALCEDFGRQREAIPASTKEAFQLLALVLFPGSALYGILGLMAGLCLSGILGIIEAILTQVGPVVAAAPVTMGLIAATVSVVGMFRLEFRYPEGLLLKQWVAPAKLAEVMLSAWWRHLHHFALSGGLHRLPEQGRLPFPSPDSSS